MCTVSVTLDRPSVWVYSSNAGLRGQDGQRRSCRIVASEKRIFYSSGLWTAWLSKDGEIFDTAWVRAFVLVNDSASCFGITGINGATSGASAYFTVQSARKNPPQCRAPRAQRRQRKRSSPAGSLLSRSPGTRLGGSSAVRG